MLIGWRIGILCLCAASTAAAHGGAYRGPGSSKSNPGGKGPAVPIRGPITPIETSETGVEMTWLLWWVNNRAPYLRLRETVLEVDASAEQPVQLAPDDRDRRQLVLPPLKLLIDHNNNRDVVTAVMVAMAKMGVDDSKVDVLGVFREQLKRSDQEVRETAALCLGLSHRADAIDDLRALAFDTKRGRQLVGRASVKNRTRAFAIHGLGLVASAQADLEVKSAVFDSLVGLLALPGLDDRDILVAIVSAIGLLEPDVDRPGHKRLLWRALDELRRFYEADLGKARILVQAHAPIAIARLLGRGTSPEHQRSKRELLDALEGRRDDQLGTVVQSAAIALGKLVVPREESEADAEFSDALVEYCKDGKNRTARAFSMIALAEIGGDHNRAELLRIAAKSRREFVAWSAIALGVLGYDVRDAGAPVDVTVGRAIQKLSERAKDDETLAAISIGLGLCGHRDAVGDLLTLMKRNSGHDILCSFTCEALGLMRAQEATDRMREMLDESARWPLLLNRAAIGLGLLGEKDTNTKLVELLSDDSESLASLAAIASAFRYVGDRRAIAPLLDRLHRADSQLTRAFLAASLGAICDKDTLPWNAGLGVGSNYNAAVPTLTDGARGILDIL